jgi:murein DD-endopeptidase MepM/ murein hydrolase activator NlpD
MYGDEVQVVSAAAGTIVDKRDGNYDRNCTVGQGASWNAVYVRHGDGSVAWYGHLKNGSLTSKTVGSYVQAGEYLGIVGSSGGSLEPHLHFELYDASNHLIDAYEGACNSLNSQSWWASQRPYYDSAINLLMTGDAPVENQPCPNPTITHAADRFNPGDTVYFTAFYRDLLAGQVSQGAIYRPDGSVFQSWTYSNTTPHVPARTKWWSYRLSSDAMHGTWRFEVVYAGQTYRTLFSVGDLLRTYLPVVLKTH